MRVSAGAGITAAGHVLSRASVAAHRIDVRGLLRRVAVSASVSVAIGALAGPASAAVYGALGSTLATGAVASGLISTAPLLTTEALEGRWAAIAATGGGHGAALAAALKDVFTVASVGVVTGGVMGTLAQAVATSHGLLAEGGRWGVALATVARAQRVAQAPQRRAARRSGIAPRAGTTPLAVTLAALDAAAAAEPGGGVGGGAPSDDGRAAAASQAREG